MVQEGVLRDREVIGEAAKRLADAYRATHPEVPWRALARDDEPPEEPRPGQQSPCEARGCGRAPRGGCGRVEPGWTGPCSTGVPGWTLTTACPSATRWAARGAQLRGQQAGAAGLDGAMAGSLEELGYDA
jgi:hypothetical protein